DLSTWYLRRSRPRFWVEEVNDDKRIAADCLAFALLNLARVLAPMAPYTAEFVFGEVQRSTYDRAEESVHLQTWPQPIHRHRPEVEEAMSGLRALVEVGRELRQRAAVKSRIPLEELVLIGVDEGRFAALGGEADRLLSDELNVRGVRWVASATAAELPDDEWVRREGADGPTMALKRHPTPELLAEGYVREALRRLQMTRKELGLRFQDRVAVRLYAEGDLFRALEGGRDRLRIDLLCDTLEILQGPAPDAPSYRRWEIDGHAFAAQLELASP
ncbi:MAG: class I tRNA ligase family protein, partial [Thermoplasmata archaeon]|nr:class I tRNA ligase family protein [Thermoplasmata archaeon]